MVNIAEASSYIYIANKDKFEQERLKFIPSIRLTAKTDNNESARDLVKKPLFDGMSNAEEPN